MGAKPVGDCQVKITYPSGETIEFVATQIECCGFREDFIPNGPYRVENRVEITAATGINGIGSMLLTRLYSLQQRVFKLERQLADYHVIHGNPLVPVPTGVLHAELDHQEQIDQIRKAWRGTMIPAMLTGRVIDGTRR